MIEATLFDEIQDDKTEIYWGYASFSDAFACLKRLGKTVVQPHECIKDCNIKYAVEFEDLADKYRVKIIKLNKGDVFCFNGDGSFRIERA